MLEIYLDPCTINSRKVLAGLDLLGTKYEYNFINYFEGGQKDPEFVKNVNPLATVPAAKDGDLRLTESNAIMMYAADLGSETSAYPKDLKKRADVNKWLLFEASVWFPSCYVYLIENVVQPMLGSETNQQALSDQDPKFHKLAAALDEPLGKTKYLCGDDVTIADIAIAANMHGGSYQKLPLDKHPNLKRWYDDMKKLDCWKNTQGAVDKAFGFKSDSETNGASKQT